MADAEAKAKAEKIAAARKRVELLKKKAKRAGTKIEETSEPTKGSEPEKPASEETPETKDNDGTEAAEDSATPEEPGDSPPPQYAASAAQRSPSLSLQSKMRSSSFRKSISGPLSPISALRVAFNPEEDTAPEIYRKQAARIEELEKENKRLAKEAADGERRWKKTEEELEDLREADVDNPRPLSDENASISTVHVVEKLKAEIAALQRQNSQLHAQVSRPTRHGSSPSMSAGLPSSDLSALLASKSSTIESMEIEISNLSAQLARTASGSTAEKEQIAALEEKLYRTQKSLDTSQQELTDLKKNLERTTEKAVKEGSERTSAEIKMRTLERETREANSQSLELHKKVEALEKKVTTLTTLHKEHDARSQALKREREKAEKEAIELRHRLAGIENENLRLREERERTKKREAQGIDDEGVDELENEARQRLEHKIRELEGEVFELRRGVWRDRRKEIDGNHGDSELSPGAMSPGAKFTDIDLSGNMSPSRRRSLGPASAAAKGLGDLFASGLSAFAGAASTAGTGSLGIGGIGRHGHDPLLEDDPELDFDEEAFRIAQEEEARKRIERVREIKRALNDWKGWRLDIVEMRRVGGEGVGEIFEI